MKGRKLKKCIENAVHCLLLSYWMHHKISVDEIQRYLQENLWTNTASKYRTETEENSDADQRAKSCCSIDRFCDP